jgi:threonine 3-dehydrogenase
MAAMIVKHSGARNVVITDINPDRLGLAKQMGVQRPVDITKEKLSNVMNELGMKEGFDVGLEMSGSPKALNDMIDVMFHGGSIALLGILPASAAVNWEKIVFNGITIRGIYGRKMFETWYKMTSIIQSGLDISKIITHRFSYKDYKEAFELMKSGKTGKVILNWIED